MIRFLILAAAAMVNVAPPSDLAELEKKLHHEDDSVRVGAVKALGRMNSIEATRLLPDLLLDPNTYVRDWTYMTLTKIKDPASVKFLSAEAIRRPEVKIRLDLAEWAGEGGVSGAVPALVGLLEDKSPPVRLAAAEALAEIGDRSAAPDLKGRLGERKAPLRARFLIALGRLAGEEAAEEVEKGLRSRAWEVRVASVSLAKGCLARDAALEAGIRAMRDKAWPVRAAAIELLGDLEEGKGVEPLISAMEAEGRLRHDAYVALMRLTGEDIPLEPDLWRRWWEVAREKFEPPGKGPSIDDPRKKTRTRLRYHGLPIVSNRIAFVLDLSGSMRDPLEKGGGPTKLDLAREELTRVIRGLDKKAVFNIYFYNEEVTSWRKQAAPATRKHRSDAAAFLARQKALGYTNLYGALKAALDDLEVDTIYLLSDGGPSRGEVIFKDRILGRVAGQNRVRRVVIHAIDTGSRKWHQTELLQDLSKASGGFYLRLGKEGGGE